MGSFLSAPARSGGVSGGQSVAGNGIVVNADGVALGRTLLAGPGMKIDNPEGRDGKPTFSIFPPGHIASVKRVPLHIAGETQIVPDVEGLRYFTVTHVLICNATGNSGSVSVGLYTLAGKLGDAILSPTPTGGLIDSTYSTLKLVPSLAMQRKRAAPTLFLVPEVLSPTELYVDVYVRGEVLDWEIA